MNWGYCHRTCGKSTESQRAFLVLASFSCRSQALKGMLPHSNLAKTQKFLAAKHGQRFFWVLSRKAGSFAQATWNVVNLAKTRACGHNKIPGCRAVSVFLQTL